MESPFQAIAEFTYDWESWITSQGELKWVNSAVQRITGYNPEQCLQMIDYPFPMVYPADRPSVARILEQGCLGESGNHFEFRVLRKDGQIRWAAVSWQPITVKGESVGFRSSIRDIHERKQMESDLQSALQQAEAADHARTEFLANMTHEFRTPLQSIIGYTQILEAESLEEPAKSYVNTLRQQGEQLEKMVSDLLDFSVLQVGMLPLRVQQYSLEEILQQIVTALKPLAEKKDLELQLHVEELLTPTGDPHRLSQVVTNLVVNAIKYTSSGRVRVKAKTASERNEFLVCVEDTGPGLPKGFCPFEPFSQGASSAISAPEGVGLGLAISDRLCTHMGGCLEAKSSELGGARLEVRLPYTTQEGSSSIAYFDQGPSITSEFNEKFAKRFPLSVLVIDDLQAPRDFMGVALRALGYHPYLVSSSDEAFKLIEKKPIDIALIDIQMPEVDGWATAQRLRARLEKEVYLVALTAQSMASNTRRLEQFGFDGYTEKPIRLEALQMLLSQAFEHQQSQTWGALFDSMRWEEMEQVTTREGGTLLELMEKRVGEHLPVVLQEIEETLQTQQETALRKALHDAGGLLGIIGATQAQRLAAECEQAENVFDESELTRLLNMGNQVIKWLRRHAD